MKTEISRFVKKLVDEHDTRDPFKICRQRSILVVRQPLLEMRGFYLCEKNTDIIILADDLPDYVEHFVCAHELGHALHHKGLNCVFMDSRTFLEPTRYENSADKFACQLLWSEAPLLQETQLTDLQMSECLNIPTHNINARLLELGIYW